MFFIQQAITESIFPQISKATKFKEAWDEYENTTKIFMLLVSYNTLKGVKITSPITGVEITSSIIKGGGITLAIIDH